MLRRAETPHPSHLSNNAAVGHRLPACAACPQSLALFLKRLRCLPSCHESVLRKGADFRSKVIGKSKSWRISHRQHCRSTHAISPILRIYCTLFLAEAAYGQLSNEFSGITRNNPRQRRRRRREGREAQVRRGRVEAPGGIPGTRNALLVRSSWISLPAIKKTAVKMRQRDCPFVSQERRPPGFRRAPQCAMQLSARRPRPTRRRSSGRAPSR